MSWRPSRRGLFTAASALAATPALTALADGGQGAAATTVPRVKAAAPDRSWSARPFGLGEVSLLPGIFATKRDLMLQYLESLSVDRILVVFRRTAGLPENGAQPLGGWETFDQLVRGHYAGHLLSAFSQAHGSVPNPVLKTKIDQIVDGLEECRTALQALPNPPSHPGYLAAFPEQQFILLETTVNDSRVWAPYYTCHKVLKGLLDAYLYTGNSLALQLADGLGQWVHSRLSRLTKAQRDAMWVQYSKGEFGGLPEALVDLAETSGNDLHLTTAGYFDIDRLITGAAAGNDTLTGLHSNQHIPVLTGYIRMFDNGADEKYWTTGSRTWDWIVPPRMYAIGGTSNNEHWAQAGQIASQLGTNAAETCCAHNMLKLSRLLFWHEQDAKYIEFYERALFNQILGSRRDTPGTDSPGVTYYIGMNPGHRRGFGNTGTCCGGTGVENATKYQDTIWARSADDSVLYLNLFIASQLTWADKGVTIRQDTTLPLSDTTSLTVTGTATFTLRVRVPGWVGPGYRVQVNGTDQDVSTAVPGSYLSLTRTWADGDTVTIRMPQLLVTESAPDNRAIQALRYGPSVLAFQDASTQTLRISLYANRRLDGSYEAEFTPTGAPLRFTKDGRQVVPFHLGVTEPTHVYFQRHEPLVVFGGLNTGLPNRSLNGRNLLDQVWDGAPFADRAALVRRIGEVAADFVDAEVYSRADRQRMMLTAGRGRF